MLEWCSTALTDARSRYVALFCVAASWLWPFSGVGVDVCMLHATTGLPCPGCGMTRAFVAFADGDWAVAVGANPFVLVAWPTFAALGVLALLPERWVSPLLSRLGPRVARAYGVLVAGFLGFGLVRFGYFALTGQEFP